MHSTRSKPGCGRLFSYGPKGPPSVYRRASRPRCSRPPGSSSFTQSGWDFSSGRTWRLTSASSAWFPGYRSSRCGPSSRSCGRALDRSDLRGPLSGVHLRSADERHLEREVLRRCRPSFAASSVSGAEGGSNLNLERPGPRRSRPAQEQLRHQSGVRRSNHAGPSLKGVPYTEGEACPTSTTA